MIDINQQFDTSTLSDVAYTALIILSEDDQSLEYIHDFYENLTLNQHWLVQLLYCFNKFDNKNFYLLCSKLNYNADQLTQAFQVITRKV